MKKSAVLSGTALFRGIEETEFQGLLSCLEATERRFQKGETVLRRGDRTERMGLLLEGTVHIVREDFWGNRSMVGLAVSGDIFAESYSLTGETLEVSVLAATDCEILFFNASKAVSGCAQVCSFHEQLSRNLLGILARKNLLLTEKMRHMARKTTREKLLSYLSAQALQASGPEFDIPLDRQQLADFLGVERSAMSAALGKLRDEGVLEFRKNHFRLLRSEEE
jgi:CRP-like cAMP-binding protein